MMRAMLSRIFQAGCICRSSCVVVAPFCACIAETVDLVSLARLAMDASLPARLRIPTSVSGAGAGDSARDPASEGVVDEAGSGSGAEAGSPAWTAPFTYGQNVRCSRMRWNRRVLLLLSDDGAAGESDVNDHSPTFRRHMEHCTSEVDAASELVLALPSVPLVETGVGAAASSERCQPKSARRAACSGSASTGAAASRDAPFSQLDETRESRCTSTLTSSCG